MISSVSRRSDIEDDGNRSDDGIRDAEGDGVREAEGEGEGEGERKMGAAWSLSANTESEVSSAGLARPR